MRIDRLARTLENSQGMVHGRKGKAVSLKSAEQRIDTGSMHAAVSKQAFAPPGIGLAITTAISQTESVSLAVYNGRKPSSDVEALRATCVGPSRMPRATFSSPCCMLRRGA